MMMMKKKKEEEEEEQKQQQQQQQEEDEEEEKEKEEEAAFIDKTYLYPNFLRYLRTNLGLDADVSENTLPFVSQFYK